jgi:hypothetical protein
LLRRPQFSNRLNCTKGFAALIARHVRRQGVGFNNQISACHQPARPSCPSCRSPSRPAPHARRQDAPAPLRPAAGAPTGRPEARSGSRRTACTLPGCFFGVSHTDGSSEKRADHNAQEASDKLQMVRTPARRCACRTLTGRSPGQFRTRPPPRRRVPRPPQQTLHTPGGAALTSCQPQTPPAAGP